MKTIAMLPGFTGFYNTSLGEPDVYGELDYVNGLRLEKHLEPLDNDNDLEYNYAEYFLQMSKVCTDSVCEFLQGLEIVNSIKFLGLVSPKYYNYSNDKIECDIDYNKRNLVKYLNEYNKDFDKYLHENCSSYSGFISFYANNLREWKFKTNNFVNLDSAEITIILNFILYNEKFSMENQIYNVGMKNYPTLYVSNIDYLLTL